jgi:Trm5-related predicted tRNA methylase
MLAVSERAIIATAENAEKALTLCEELKKDEINHCLDSLIQVSQTQFDNPELTSQLIDYQAKFFS